MSSVYKQFLSGDVIITPYNAIKDFEFDGVNNILNGIDFYIGKNIDTKDIFYTNENKSGLVNQQYDRLTYNFVRQLYYSNDYKSQITTITSSIDSTCIENKKILAEIVNQLSESNNRWYDYPQTSLYFVNTFPTQSLSEISVISIPQILYGDNIIPSSLVITFDGNTYNDDGEGNIIYNNNIVGNIFYSHGICVMHSGNIYNLSYRINTQGELFKFNIKYKSKHTLFENQYKCVIRDNEYNYTLNPSTYDCNGNMLDNIKDDNFTPYLTTVGLYNDNKELLMVAKLSKPIKISETTDTIIQINFDNF